jgi:demethylmenaquinone methyltransferase/2-methoxy-6-polyprenyl-1,4-benzoquinol methylase
MTATNTADPRQAFFDTIAEAWDGWHDLAALTAKLNAAFGHLGIRPAETVVDVGCGTGNLSRALLAVLGPTGSVLALDISPAMLKQARQKVADPRVTWYEAPADRIPAADASCDRIICFSSWPHFENPEAVVREFHRALRGGGHVHILHLISREAVNRIHGGAHPSVRGDLLAPVGEVAALFERGGFTVLETADDGDGYLLTAHKQA